jgi:1-acyl-sn-glycerol-3-phosphate acyltransferase
MFVRIPLWVRVPLIWLLVAANTVLRVSLMLLCAFFKALLPIKALQRVLEAKGHYLVLSNHQSWVDILILQKVFNRRIPFMRFFLKQQLIWVPMLGLAWWALDFPFMQRHTKSQLQKRPELAGQDIAATRKACEKFLGKPVSIMIFPEGTRFTPAKHAQQQSPFQHLLKPKSGGMAYACMPYWM